MLKSERCIPAGLGFAGVKDRFQGCASSRRANTKSAHAAFDGLISICSGLVNHLACQPRKEHPNHRFTGSCFLKVGPEPRCDFLNARKLIPVPGIAFAHLEGAQASGVMIKFSALSSWQLGRPRLNLSGSVQPAAPASARAKPAGSRGPHYG